MGAVDDESAAEEAEDEGEVAADERVDEHAAEGGRGDPARRALKSDGVLDDNIQGEDHRREPGCVEGGGVQGNLLGVAGGERDFVRESNDRGAQ